MSDFDSKVFVRTYLNEGAVPQRDIDLALAHEANQASAHQLTTSQPTTGRFWRRGIGQLGRFLVAISERPSQAPKRG